MVSICRVLIVIIHPNVRAIKISKIINYHTRSLSNKLSVFTHMTKPPKPCHP